MTNVLRLCGILVALTVQAVAAPVTWTLTGVVFNDGGTATGSFTYDASTNTYSSVNITTTTGSSRTGTTYHFVCGQDVPSCVGLPPTSGFFLNLTTSSATQTGLPGMALSFGTALTNSGGLISAFALEGTCSNAACLNPVAPTRNSIAGSVSAAGPPATPVPTSLLLAATGLLLAGLFFWWKQGSAGFLRSLRG